jgi:hypothetical protein
MATWEPLSLLMAAGGGFFHDGKDTSSLPDNLFSTDSLVFLSTFNIADSVTIAGNTIWRSWYLPLGCNAPIGLTWKLEGILYDDITASVSALFTRSADHFISLLDTRRDDFVDWLAAVTAAPDVIAAVSAVPWSSFAADVP